MNDEAAGKGNAPNVFYGDLKYAPQSVVVKKFQDAQKALCEAEAELERRKKFTPAQIMADRLHRLLHMSLDCDYAYSDWGSTLTSCRAQFLGLAERIIALMHPHVTNSVITEMEKIKYGPTYRETLP